MPYSVALMRKLDVLEGQLRLCRFKIPGTVTHCLLFPENHLNMR